MKKIKKAKKLLVVICCLCLLVGVVGITSFAGNQVTNSGGTNNSDEVTVSKTISETGTENLFDITLRVEATKEAANYIKQPPMAIAIVLDVSNTMFTSNLYGPSRDAMEDFVAMYCADSVGACAPRELSVITFNTNATVMYPLSDCKNKSASSIINSLDEGMKTITDDVYGYNDSDDRFTNMEAGLRLADNVLSNSKAENKYIIFFTDGIPTTYIDREGADFNSTAFVRGYCPISASGTVGADGVFYNVPTSQYCYSGTNYSNKGALYAANQAKAIKDKNIKIYSVGMNIDSQKPVEDMKTFTVDYDGIGDYVVNTSTEQLFDSSVWNYKYKNWLYSVIGSGYYSDGSNLEQLHRVYDEIYSKITADSKTTMEDRWKASDPMNSDSSNKNIEFISFYDKSGNLTNSLSGMTGAGSENTASFDTDNEKINWDLLNSGYTITNVDGNDKYVYELKYRVRLKNEKDGFLSNTSLPANGETTLKYVSVENGVVTNKVINFPIPEVKGYLADLEFTKVDGLNDDIGGTPLSGAGFKLTHSASCHQCMEIGKHIDIADKIVNANAAGQVLFSSIPSGHCYDLLETAAPEGYICPAVPYSVEVKEGIVYINGNQAGNTLGNEPKKFDLNYVITSSDNPAIDKTDVTPSTKTDIPYNRDVTLESGLTTTDTTDKNGVPGTWTFSGWYDNPECTGVAITTKNIKKDETVYGKWNFTPTTYELNYVITGTDKPSSDKTDATPSKKTGIAYNTDETLAPSLTTTDDEKGDIFGTWTFSGWYDNPECTGSTILTKNIKKDETVYGKWDFTPVTCELSYIITGTDKPASDKTDATPSKKTGIIYNTDETLAPGLTTTDDKKGDVPGTWTFSGWYDNPECTGSTILIKNIIEDEAVFGKWDFTPTTYELNYVITGTDKPASDKTNATPATKTGIAYNTDETLECGLTTTDTTDKNGVPGTWTFSGWYDNPECSGVAIITKNIKKDETVYGKWDFTPTTYELNYVITGTDKPASDKTDATPSKKTGIIYNTDETLAPGLTTTDDKKGDVPGTWTFSGWYDNPECTGSTILIKNIKEDEAVFGKWDFTPTTYELNYVITGEDKPASDKTDATPATKTGIAYNTDETLEGGLNTTDTTDKNGVPGTWTFSGWYDNPECTGVAITTKNIKKDETVYGKWNFTPTTYELNYVITGTDKPESDKTDATPSKKTGIAYNTDETLEDGLTTTDTTDKNGVPGTWTFSGWYDNPECTGVAITTKNIKKDETVYGKWNFTPTTYELNYVITGEDKPASDKTDATPATKTGIAYNTDETLEGGLTTTDTTDKNGVPGTWTFSGWYDNPECTGVAITTKNIKKR